MCLEDSLPVVRRSVHMSFECFLLNMLFRFTGKGGYHPYWLLDEPTPHSMVGQCQISSWMMLHPSHHIDISFLGVTTAAVPTEEEDGGGTMFVLYLSEPVLLSLINSVYYRETPRKSCLPRGKGERTRTWKLSSIERNMGVQLHTQISLLWCSLPWTQELTEEQGQNWQGSVCPCAHSLSEFREVCTCSVAQPHMTRSWCSAFLDNTITKLEATASVISFYWLLLYSLFQNRVVHQNPGERNYHIFYALLAGVSGEQKGNFIFWDMALSSFQSSMWSKCKPVRARIFQVLDI